MYVFHSDPGHAWLEVPRDELKKLGILSDISCFSYQDGESVFLEEDCDFPIFLEAKKKVGQKFDKSSYVEEHTNSDSYIRNLKPYRQ